MAFWNLKVMHILSPNLGTRHADREDYVPSLERVQPKFSGYPFLFRKFCVITHSHTIGIKPGCMNTSYWECVRERL